MSDLLTVPPLRERLEDIPLLVGHLLANGCAGADRLSIARDAIELLDGYTWDGNVRELRSVVEAARTLRAEGMFGLGEMRRALERMDVRPLGLADRRRWAERQALIEQLERGEWDTGPRRPAARRASSNGLPPYRSAGN